MITERKLANALSGKTARACDSCSRKRARWFCAADDAFLCQYCDESVHSANQLASRHERVRLESASSKTSDSIDSPPAWHQGFTRKARTPRPNNNNNNNNKSIYKQHKTNEDKVLNSKNDNNSPPLLLPLVPEIGSEEEGNCIFADEDDDQLLYRVPVFDPFAAELCTDDIEGNEIAMGNEENMFFDGCYGKEQEGSCELDNLSAGFLPSDMDLAEFAADVENLLATGLDDDSPDIKDLGLLEFCNKNKDQENNDHKVVMKVKDEQEMDSIAFDHMARESLMDWSFNYESPMTGDEEEEQKVVPVADKGVLISCSKEHKKEMKRNVSLRLNYEAVITAWASHGSPWTTGSRPAELNPDDCWPDCMGTCPKEGHNHHLYGGHTGSGNGGREARVLRYKEKRRTRLFSKKIRYEVRKLNAEKRPRMKGRFVKRDVLHGINCFSLHEQINNTLKY